MELAGHKDAYPSDSFMLYVDGIHDSSRLESEKDGGNDSNQQAVQEQP